MTLSNEQRRRDGASLMVLGVFFMVQAVFVLLGALWLEPSFTLVVSLASGSVLFLIGLVMFAAGRRIHRRGEQSTQAVSSDKGR
jgi:hypothetical protein